MTTLQEIAAQRPRDIDEAIPALKKALDWYHENNDYRAVFLRAYYIITVNVHAAVHGRGEWRKGIFFDPDWIASLAGKFSSLYFQSLTTFERSPESELAWKVAHRLAEDRSSTVVQDLLLGLNAHINYDLAYGIYMNFKEHGDDRNHLLLPRRKFDHDQVNEILLRSIPEITTTLARDYGGAIRFLDVALDRLDDLLAGTGLRYYRERVWWDAVSYLTTADEQELGLVHEKLNRESASLANLIADRSFWSLPIRVVGSMIRKRRFGKIEMGGVPAAPPVAVAAAA
jgi:tetratricopeptide (TPR) repeat protein